MSQAVITEVVQEMEKLPDDLQRQVLEFTKRLTASVPRGVPGKNLLHFVGTIPADELQQMRQAIEQDCEQIDLNEW
ncbi:MAG: hypothetical protein KDJ65_21290 [Anaerolineae bacterium]|nr:hypothetical protein [Anaerolineae bacterium]